MACIFRYPLVTNDYILFRVIFRYYSDTIQRFSFKDSNSELP